MHRLLSLVVLVLVVGLGLAGSRAAAQVDASEAAEFCRQLEEARLQDATVLQTTRVECDNWFQGPSSEQANNVIAGLCGEALFREMTGTTNKEQCIAAASEVP